MDNYLVLKFIHILSAMVLAGTGVGIAFFMFMAGRTDNLQAIAETVRNVVLADWLFTAPAIVIQLVSGIGLMKKLDYSFSSAWFYTSIGLYLFILVCWVPAVVVQYKVKHLARDQLLRGVLDKRFKTMMRLWSCLGVPAFIGIIFLFWLMILKPITMF